MIPRTQLATASTVPFARNVAPHTQNPTAAGPLQTKLQDPLYPLPPVSSPSLPQGHIPTPQTTIYLFVASISPSGQGYRLPHLPSFDPLIKARHNPTPHGGPSERVEKCQPNLSSTLLPPFRQFLPPLQAQGRRSRHHSATRSINHVCSVHRPCSVPARPVRLRDDKSLDVPSTARRPEMHSSNSSSRLTPPPLHHCRARFLTITRSIVHDNACRLFTIVRCFAYNLR